MTAFDVGGAARWSRPVAAAECGGSDVSVSAVTVTTSGVVVVGGALRGAADLGRGRLEPRRTDGFVAAFGPWGGLPQAPSSVPPDGAFRARFASATLGE